VREREIVRLRQIKKETPKRRQRCRKAIGRKRVSKEGSRGGRGRGGREKEVIYILR
jgi:hypothetical protein